MQSFSPISIPYVNLSYSGSGNVTVNATIHDSYGALNSLTAGEVIDAQLASSSSTIGFSSKTEAQFEESYTLTEVVDASSALDLIKFIEGEEMEGGVQYFVYPSATASIGLVTTNFALPKTFTRNFSISATTENSVTLQINGTNPSVCANSSFNIYW